VRGSLGVQGEIARRRGASPARLQGPPSAAGRAPRLLREDARQVGSARCRGAGVAWLRACHKYAQGTREGGPSWRDEQNEKTIACLLETEGGWKSAGAGGWGWGEWGTGNSRGRRRRRMMHVARRNTGMQSPTVSTARCGTQMTTG